VSDTGWALVLALYALLLAASIPVTAKATLWWMDRRRTR
jgi:hypothetical protein